MQILETRHGPRHWTQRAFTLNHTVRNLGRLSRLIRVINRGWSAIHRYARFPGHILFVGVILGTTGWVL
jgi:hypothetical protein